MSRLPGLRPKPLPHASDTTFAVARPPAVSPRSGGRPRQRSLVRPETENLLSKAYSHSGHTKFRFLVDNRVAGMCLGLARSRHTVGAPRRPARDIRSRKCELSAPDIRPHRTWPALPIVSPACLGPIMDRRCPTPRALFLDSHDIQPLCSGSRPRPGGGCWPRKTDEGLAAKGVRQETIFVPPFRAISRAFRRLQPRAPRRPGR